MVAVLAGCATPADRLRNAIAAENQGNYDSAIQTFTSLIAVPGTTDPVKATLYDLRCVAYERSDHIDSAIADCNEALRLKPDLEQAYNNRAMAYFRAGQFDLMIADLDVAAKLKPDDPTAFSNRGIAYLRKADPKRALTDFDEAIRLKADYAAAYTFRGQAYLMQSDIQKAEDDESQAIRLNPKDSLAYDTRAIIRSTKADFVGAGADFDAAIADQPKGAGFYLDRGVLELSLSQLDRATSDLAEAQNLTRTNSYAIMWLHIARRKGGTDDTAEIDRNAAGLDQTKWPGPIVALYRNQYDPQKLLDLAAQAVGDANRQLRCQIYFHVGEYDLLNRDTTHAKALFQQAIDTCPIPAGERLVAQTELKAIGK